LVSWDILMVVMAGIHMYTSTEEIKPAVRD